MEEIPPARGGQRVAAGDIAATRADSAPTSPIEISFEFRDDASLFSMPIEMRICHQCGFPLDRREQARSTIAPKVRKFKLLARETR